MGHPFTQVLKQAAPVEFNKKKAKPAPPSTPVTVAAPPVTAAAALTPPAPVPTATAAATLSVDTGAAPPAEAPPSAAGGAADIVVKHAPGTGPGKHAFDRLWPAKGGRTATATFEIMFDPSFEWGCGGKVGGFGVGTGKSSGGRHSADGASFRLMWQANGGAIGYMYMPEGTHAQQPPPLQRQNQYGVGIWKSELAGAFKTGVWTPVEMTITLNTPGKADGSASMSIGSKKASIGGLVWRTSAGMGIENFSIATFHGGPCKATKASTSRYRGISVRAS